MAEQEQVTTAADARRYGADLHAMEETAEFMLSYIYQSLPEYPLYNGTRLTALPAARRADRISRLPRDLLRNILARLPVKDAARTAALSSRWRALWRSTPLVLVDIHLLPKAQDFSPMPANTPAVTAAVSRILETHPGSFSCVHLLSHLICCRLDVYMAKLARWLHLLAAKGIQDLILVNRPWPLNVPLPASLFTITTLTRLYLGVWKLPGTAALRGGSFSNLRELGLCFVEMEHGFVDSLVARSPALEVLNIVGYIKCRLRLRLVSQSLRCVQICGSVLEDIAVVKAPCLERLILSSPYTPNRGLCASQGGHGPGRSGPSPSCHLDQRPAVRTDQPSGPVSRDRTGGREARAGPSGPTNHHRRRLARVQRRGGRRALVLWRGGRRAREPAARGRRCAIGSAVSH
ncbi:F-box/LRR-repeat protein 13-like [Triticum urartu]|uniref:F-box/LRR-repeat protein 13-like n=1 Tax=Triticum urartu TaxID=4572 RepID=UPI00204402AD|nr:F-box/LRR-repeat protein 13-like [Triticum urartu]